MRGDQHGFTLIELMMAVTIGVGVILAAFTVATATMHAQTRVSDRSEAIARGRTAMEQIVQELRSQVCLGPGYPAISYADGNHVTFAADLRDTNFIPQRRDLVYANGTLTERDYDGYTQTDPDEAPYGFETTPSRTRVILDHLRLQTVGGETVPFFTYYSFNADDPIRPSNVLSTPLASDDLSRVVQIGVNFAALPSRGGDGVDGPGEPFSANVYVRTADPTDPDHSPLCI